MCIIVNGEGFIIVIYLQHISSTAMVVRQPFKLPPSFALFKIFFSERGSHGKLICVRHSLV